jgi:hypothetical protein
MKSHNFIKLQPVLQQWNQLNNLADEIQYLRHSRKLQDNLGASPLVNNIYQTLQNFINGNENPKWIQFSAHDTTIVSLFATLDLTGTYDLMKRNPLYGSQVIFELHQQPGEGYFVRLVYRFGYNGEYTAYKLPKYCDSDLCKWDSFVSYIKEKSLVSMSQWCSRCGNTAFTECAAAIQNKAKTENLALLISVPILATISFSMVAILLIILTRSRSNRQYTQIA